MKKKALVIILCLAALAAGSLCSLPYVKIYQILSALRGQDQERIARYVDFSQLRAGLKDRIRAAEPPVRMEGADKVRQAVQTRVMEYAVDQLITPEGLLSFVRQNVPALKAGQDNPGRYDTLTIFAGFFWQARFAYVTASEFRVTFQGGQDRAIRCFMRREGWDWRLSRIEWDLPEEKLKK